MEQEARHRCMLYQGSPIQHLPALAALMRDMLAANYRCLYLNNPLMLSGIRSALADLGVSVVDEVVKGNLVLSSEPNLAPDGTFDIELMLDGLEDALDRALGDGYAGLWASGDMTWEFGQKENFVKLLEYEWRLEELIQRRPELCGICQYHHDTLPPEFMRQGMVSHKSIFINETLSCMNPHYAQSKLQAERQTANPELDTVLEQLYKMHDRKG